MKKQALSLILAALLLAGCGAAPQGGGTASGSEAAQAEASAAPLYKLERGDSHGYYLAHTIIPSTSEEPNGVYRLMYIDYAAQTMQPLCSVDGCTHETTDCPAVQLATSYGTPFTMSDGRLLFWAQDVETQIADLYIGERSGRTITMTEIKPDLLEGRGIAGEPFYTDGTALYCETYRNTDEGSSEFELNAFDLSDGSCRVVSTLSDSAYVFGAYGRSLLLKETTPTENSTSFSELSGVQYLLLDVDTGEQTVLRTYPGYGESQQGRSYDYEAALFDGQLYEFCYTTRALTVTDLATNETRTLAEQMPADPNEGRGAFDIQFTRVVNGYLVAEYFSNDWENETVSGDKRPIYLVDLQTGEVREKPTLPTIDYNGYGHNPLVWAQTDSLLLMTCRIEPYTATEILPDGSVQTFQSSHSYLGLLPTEDYLSGTPNYIEVGLYD